MGDVDKAVRQCKRLVCPYCCLFVLPIRLRVPAGRASARPFRFFTPLVEAEVTTREGALEARSTKVFPSPLSPLRH
jgi:hypothetical protein